ncbi:MAG: hypothetical protein EOO71_09850 [Myxococcaceae bacterium]|nr:MAG: hypothetical protein EOO71_09850 [Myxococcaceae bacterium]
MKLFSKALFAGAAALLLSPLTSFAAGFDCESVCSPIKSCIFRCSMADGSIITCREYGVCKGPIIEPAAPQMPVQPPSSEDSEPVCRAPDAPARG